MTAYRDAIGAKRSLLENLTSEIRSIEARLFVEGALDAAYGPRSPPSIAWRAQRDRVMNSGDERASLDELALDEEISLAESVVAQWRLLAKDVGGLERAMLTPGDVAPLPSLSRRSASIAVSNGMDPMVLDEARELPAQVTERLTALGCQDVTSSWKVEPAILAAPWVFEAAALRREIPYALRFELWHQMGALVSHTIVTTSVPRARRPLYIVTRGAWWKRLVADRRTLGAETATGNTEIDDTYAVRGTDASEFVGALLEPLRTLLRCDAPEVVVRDGVATVAWRYDPEREVLKATLAILDHLRDAPSRFSLRRDDHS